MYSNRAKNIFYKVSVIFILILGVVLRSYSFCVFRPLWRDECSLALNIYFRNFSDFWGVLYHTQSAPPIFMTISKLFNMISPAFPEYSLRLFPYLSGIISIYLFYLLSKKIFDSKLAIIISNFAFAVNTQLIYYSHEFKQYSSDVMVILGSILYLSKLKFSELTTKQILMNALLLALLPLLSLPAFLVITAWLLLSSLNKQNFKKIIITIIPIFFINIPYYLYILKPSQKIMLENSGLLWAKGFLSLNFDSVYYIINNNLSFYFQQCKYIIIPLLLLITGLIYAVQRRSEIDKLITALFFIVIMASFMSVYPIQERVSLYLLPLVTILIVLPLNFLNRKLIKVIFTILMCFILFGKNNYTIIGHNSENSALFMQILKTNYHKDDYIIYNDASDSQYEIYSYIYNFEVPDNRLGRLQLADYGEYWYYNVLNNLPKGQKYWFYYAYDLDAKPVIPLLKNWTHRNGQIMYELHPDKKSYLVYVKL